MTKEQEIKYLLWKAITNGSGWSDADLKRARELTEDAPDSVQS